MDLVFFYSFILSLRSRITQHSDVKFINKDFISYSDIFIHDLNQMVLVHVNPFHLFPYF